MSDRARAMLRGLLEVGCWAVALSTIVQACQLIWGPA